MTSYATLAAEKHLPIRPTRAGIVARLKSSIDMVAGFVYPTPSIPAFQLVPAPVQPGFDNRWEQERPVR